MLAPDDHELLCDLLDERLSAAQERALSQRLADEPALRSAWDELLRQRTILKESLDAEPPVGFAHRVRARLSPVEQRLRPLADHGNPVDDSADDLSGEPGTPSRQRDAVREVAANGGFDHSSAQAGARAGSEPEIPLLWRRLMTVAYAAAALLVVGIGLLAVRDRRGDARATPPPLESARGERRDASDPVERLKDNIAEAQGNAVPPPASSPEASDLAADRPESRSPGPMPGPLPGVAPGREGDDDSPAPRSPRVESPRSQPVDKSGQGEGGAGAPPAAAPGAERRPSGPFRAPGGAVPPGLRTPSDAPSSAPSSPASPAEPASAPAPTPVLVPAPAPAPELAPAPLPTPAAAPAGPEAKDGKRGAPGAKTKSDGEHDARPIPPLLLVLEAPDLATGRALLAAVVGGPGAAVAGGGGASTTDFTQVRLRRLRPATDEALLAALPPAERARLGAERSVRERDATEPKPSAPATPSGGLPPLAPAGTAAAPTVPPPAVLGLAPLELTAEELARVEALLPVASPPGGSAPEATPTSGSGAGEARGPAVRRSVRVIVVRTR